MSIDGSNTIVRRKSISVDILEDNLGARLMSFCCLSSKESLERSCF